MNHVTTETTTTTTIPTAAVIPAVPFVPPAVLQQHEQKQEAAALTVADIANGAPSGFASFGFAEPIERALTGAGYTSPTPIQQGSIPALLQGRDMLGIAQTGTGKTAAFALPILNAIALSPQKPTPKGVRALILAPTRELVIQIADSIRTYGKHIRLKSCAVYGGVSEFHQIKAMAAGVDVLIATPGRLLDLAQRRHIRLDEVKTFVLDEADRMLDMGFIRDVNKLTAMLPPQRQSLLFSATMPNEIAHLAANLLRDPVRVEVTPAVITVERIAQKVFFVDAPRKRELLISLLGDESLSRVVVFTRTKHAANRVSEHLQKAGIPSDAIHGNKSQNARQHALENFKKGRARVLVATDIAARGIHVSDISHVINYELPNQAESYVHRIGRTARAGAEGIALSFCDRAERGFLKDIERFTRKAIPVAEHAFGGAAPAGAETDSRDGRRGPRSFAGGNRDRDQERERGGRGGFGGKRDGGRGGRDGGQGGGRRFENRDRNEAPRNETPRVDAVPAVENTERSFEHRGERHEHRGERKEFRGRSHGDRPQGDRPQGDRPQGDRPQGERKFGDRPRGDRAHGDRPQGERKFGGRPQGDRKFGDRPRGDRPHGDRPRNDRPQGDRPQGERHQAEVRDADSRPMNRTQYDRAHAERHFGSGANTNAPRAHTGDRSEGDRQETRGPRNNGDFKGPKRQGGKPGGAKHHGGAPRHDAGADRPLRRQNRDVA